MRTLTVILGRAGSRGVAGKNVRDVAGRPCAAWTIDFALASAKSQRTIVSTDCPELASLAREMGSDTIDRPSRLASDGARIDEAVRDAVTRFDVEGVYDAFAILYANVPVRPAGLLDSAIGRLESSGADSVQSYAPVGKHHPMWTCVVGESGEVRPWQGETLFNGVYRRQDLPPAHVPDGGVMVVRRAALLGECTGPHDFLGERRAGVLTEEGAVIDIDSEIDLLVADAVLRSRQGVTT
jgi:CMP-N-acetylneuraminic acid synthetase